MPLQVLKAEVMRGLDCDGLRVSDFMLSRPLTEGELQRKLTKDNFRRLREYRTMFPNTVVADVGQNPKQRPRHGQDFFPALTRNCTKFVHVPTSYVFSCLPRSMASMSLNVVCRCLSSLGICVVISCQGAFDLAALHAMPVTDELAKALKLNSSLKVPISNAALCSCAA